MILLGETFASSLPLDFLEILGPLLAALGTRQTTYLLCGKGNVGVRLVQDLGQTKYIMVKTAKQPFFSICRTATCNQGFENMPTVRGHFIS